MPTLIHFALDPFSRRMRLALSEYGVAAELIGEQPWEADEQLLELNPAGTLPVYIEDGGEAICGVEAIGEYLEETRNGRLSLIPGDAKARAEIRRLTGWFDTKFYTEVSEPVLTEKIVRRFLSRAAGGGGPDMARVRLAMSLLRGHLDYIGQLAHNRAWLAGEQLSLADFAAAAHLSVVDYIGDIPWADYPVAKGWYQRIKSRPSFRALLTDAVRGVAPPAAYGDLDF